MQESELLERLTPEARKALDFAQEESLRFNHNYIGTEHVLLGLVRLEEGIATTALQNLGVELNKVRSSVEFIIGRGDRLVLGPTILTPRSKKVIQLALDEASRMQQERVGPEHLLLGLVREGEGIAAGVLESLGVGIARVRRETYRVLGLPLPADEPEEAPRASEIRPPGVWMGTVSISFSDESITTPTRTSFLSRYRPWHIDAEQPQKTPVGTGTTSKPISSLEQRLSFGTPLDVDTLKKAIEHLRLLEQRLSFGMWLGWVVVNTGGVFTLTLYDGLADDAPSLAVIHHPPTGANFQFHCPVEHGLTYTLEGAPGSVTIIYAEGAGD